MKTRDQIKEEVFRYLADFHCSTATEDSILGEELGFDSLDEVEALMWAEDQYEIEISDEDAEQLKTVGQAIDYLHGRLSK